MLYLFAHYAHFFLEVCKKKKSKKFVILKTDEVEALNFSHKVSLTVVFPSS